MTRMHAISVVATLCVVALVLTGCEDKSYNADAVGKDAVSAV
ncbi:MAG: hypothetical protein ACYC27_08435 [Armatimonadota bacterium]